MNSNDRETDEPLAMLLNIAKGQEKDLQAVLARLQSIEDRLEVTSDRLSHVETQLESIEVQLGMEFAAVNQQLAELRVLLSGGTQPKPPEP